MDEALELTKEYISISQGKIIIIKHCHKSLLYHNVELWIKKCVNGNFDNPIGSFNGGKLSEFIGCLLLYNLNSIMDTSNHGIYWDDGLIIVDDCTLRKGDMIRKKIYWLFYKLGFKLDIQTNLKITDYLDVTLNLYNGTVSTFRKNNQ